MSGLTTTNTTGTAAAAAALGCCRDVNGGGGIWCSAARRLQMNKGVLRCAATCHLLRSNHAALLPSLFFPRVTTLYWPVGLARASMCTARADPVPAVTGQFDAGPVPMCCKYNPSRTQSNFTPPYERASHRPTGLLHPLSCHHVHPVCTHARTHVCAVASLVHRWRWTEFDREDRLVPL